MDKDALPILLHGATDRASCVERLLRPRSRIGIRGGRFCALFLAFAAAAAGMNATRDAAAQTKLAPKRGGRAVIALNQDPTSLNPVLTGISNDRMVGCLVYQALVEASSDPAHFGQIVPRLAKSWTVSPDGLTYDFKLQHAKWQDGQLFTSADVKYTFLDVSAKYASAFAALAKLIDSIETPTSDEVAIKIKHPYGPFLLSLGCRQGAAILPAHLLRGTDPRQNPISTTNPVGTGPFKLVEWRRGDYLRLVRNDDYYEPGKPYLDEVIGKIVPDSLTQVQALQTGEIDYVRLLSTETMKIVNVSPNLKMVDAEAAPALSLAFLNNLHKPLDDKRVRQALFIATDRDFLLKAIYFGVGAVGTIPFSTKIGWSVNPDIDYRKMYPFDVARANALLDEAGVKRGSNGTRFHVEILVSATKYKELIQVGLALKSMWRAIGVDVTNTAVDDATFTKRLYQDRDFDIAMDVYSTWSDPAIGLARIFQTSTIGMTFGNPEGYSNTRVDRLLEEGQNATTNEERGKFYRQAQVILADDLPVFTLREDQNFSGASRALEGFGGILNDVNLGSAWFNN